MNKASEAIVGEHTIAGRPILIQRITWKNSPGLSYDILDANTHECLTDDESFDNYPTDEQIQAVLGNSDDGVSSHDQIVLTEAHWQAITDVHDYGGYIAEEFSDIEGVLVDAQAVLGHRPGTDALALPKLLELSCWDTSDTDNHDLILTVTSVGAPPLATEPINISGIGRGEASHAAGPERARAVLAELVACRNRLMRDLGAFGDRVVTSTKRQLAAELKELEAERDRLIALRDLDRQRHRRTVDRLRLQVDAAVKTLASHGLSMGQPASRDARLPAQEGWERANRAAAEETTTCDEQGNDLSEVLADLRGSMVDGYTSETVNSALGRITSASGLVLVCVWDYFDDFGTGGNSQFYIQQDTGRLRELAGDLWAWLNGSPADPDTPASPGLPSSWLGGIADITTEDLRYTDGFHNYARRDETIQTTPGEGA